MSKLTAVREIMTKRGITTLAMESDQVEAARHIIGKTNSTEPYLSNMIRALITFPWENTTTDWQRLEAAIIVRAYHHSTRIV